MRYAFCAVAMLTMLAAADDAKPKYAWSAVNKDINSMGLYRNAETSPLLVGNAPEDGRPYIHPLAVPDGKGVLTEFSPGHHKHQTGLYVGFLKVNGRDYFHNLGKDYFRKKWAPHGGGTVDGVNVSHWTAEYDLLDKDGSTLLEQVQKWTIRDRKDHLILDLELTQSAKADVTFGKHEYGGLFLRMPWTEKTGGKAVNSEGDENGKAEGKAAKWVDIGMPIQGRKDWGHVAILDHKDNPKHPVTWRVDGQLGVGPAPSRAGDWKIDKGKSLALKYRLVVYTGDLNKDLVEKAWKEFSGEK